MSNLEPKSDETEVFRIVPVIDPNKFYEHAECSRRAGKWPNQRYYTKVAPRYVGNKTRFIQGGYGDNSWQTDYFVNEYGDEISVDYTYEGNTCFREVPARPQIINSLEEMARKLVLENIDFSEAPDYIKTIVNKDYT
jgi:hypothetical protein